MKYIHANLFTGNRFQMGSFEVRDGKFRNFCTEPSAGEDLSGPEVTDLAGALVIPGLIDLHGHGNSGYDFSTCDLEGLRQMASYLARSGITGFAPTSMTMPYADLARAFSNAGKLHALQSEHPNGMARLLGIHMEGPYFSYGKRGAQNPEYLKTPDFSAFERLYQESGALIKLVDVAPELPGAMEFIARASRLCRVSVAHTEADYDTTLQAFSRGATQMTHLFNGMNGIHHRNPGPVAAAFDAPQVFAELICDGIHIQPSVIRMVFSLFPGRVILISDALACCGMPDGEYALGDQNIRLKDRYATLPDGTLAGSASNLFDMLRSVISFGIPMEEAILSATWNPARSLGVEEELGSIEEGKAADFLVCTENLQLKTVYINGTAVS